jgi:hypothetical protein
MSSHCPINGACVRGKRGYWLLRSAARSQTRDDRQEFSANWRSKHTNINEQSTLTKILTAIINNKLTTHHEVVRRVALRVRLSLTLAFGGGKWSDSHPSHLTRREKFPVPTGHVARWMPRPVSMGWGTEKSRTCESDGIRSSFFSNLVT